MPLTSKRSVVVFPFRSSAAGAQPRMPACRAWRIIARKASDFAADAPGVVAGAVPAAPSGAADGAYPCWVTLTDENGQRAPAPLLVDGDGWNLSPTGREWTMDFNGASGTASDRLCYVVELVQDVAEAGQVNGGAAAGSGGAVNGVIREDYCIRRGKLTDAEWGTNTANSNWVATFTRPPGANRLELWSWCDGPVNVGLQNCTAFSWAVFSWFGPLSTTPGRVGWQGAYSLGGGLLSGLSSENLYPAGVVDPRIASANSTFANAGASVVTIQVPDLVKVRWTRTGGTGYGCGLREEYMAGGILRWCA